MNPTKIPTTERTWTSKTLNRRLKLSEVPALSETELATFRLELQDAATSIREQIERLGEAADPGWRQRANGKQRITHIFVIACGNEANRREREARLECARLKTQRVLESSRVRDLQHTHYHRVFHELVAKELGNDRVNDIRIQANRIVRELLNQPNSTP